MTNGTPRSVALAQVAARVGRFAREIDLSHLTPATCSAVLSEIDALVVIFRSESPALEAALLHLRTVVENRQPVAGPPIRNDLVVRRLRRLLKMLAPLAAASMTLAALPAAAAPTPTTLIGTATVGGTVLNSATGQNETVVQLIGNYSVRTDKNNVILLAQQVGDTYTAAIPDSTDPTKTNNVTYTVTAVTKDSADRVTSVTIEDAAKVASTSNVVTPITYTTPTTGGGTGTGTTYQFPAALGNVNQFSDIRKGGNGGNGRNGGGVEVCIPLIGCARIAYDPTPGGAGAPGPDFSTNITAANGNITTVTAKTPGIVVVSNGGNGGAGGKAFGNIQAARGGNAGSGGSVTANNYVDVVTKGEGSHGMLVQSTAGVAGIGGDCYIACSGGGGGSAGVGGSAIGYNFGNISTSGKGAAGVLVQSMGGNAGTGGGSVGIVGAGGIGGEGGNGGSAYARSDGVVTTTGESAHGVMAQSIGGVGGSSGDAIGVFAVGGAGGGAGKGGTSEASVGANSRTITSGDYSFGVFSQSIGGGGGVGGIAGGVVALGAKGGTAGIGGTAKVSIEDGAYVETNGIGAYGVFAQSVGGSGGTASGSGGVVALGGEGGVGANGGTVEVVSGGTIVTGADGDGKDSRGLFAQSVGGGGGSANTSGGIAVMGGDGGVAGNGGDVNVRLTKASSISTSGLGADGVFAQSVGGGGGAGASSGGVVAMGGKGDSGGTGGIVKVENQGAVTTTGVFSRGIFVQSVGGGGGSGGDGSGLVAIGGGGSKTSAGGDVTVTNSGAVVTGGNRSTGIQAQSIGGGGGDGGTSGAVFLAIGGSGGGGGAGGKVTVNDSGSIETRGNDSHGIMAQAVGGGGGNGGSSTSVSLFAGVAIGGSGDGGGKGGDATVNFSKQTIAVNGVPTAFDPSISTAGDRSRGLFVQSVGGGGGSGGFAVQTSVGIGASVSVALGGKGAGGGEGGIVTTTGNASVFTKGANSEGIFAQSVGGGGGAGGYTIATAVTAGDGAAIALGIGGSGGGGGKGGDVTMTSGGSVVTQGEFSTGLMAQSVGGGGGTGGYNVSTSAATGSLASLAVSIGIGGSGAGGGMGGVVDATFDGTIATGGLNGAGSDSAGAIIQSVGGGGGRGGVNTSGSIAAAGAVAVGVSVGLGGSGAGGGDGGKVTGVVGGDVLTTGARSNAVLIQSAGGGGGSGGFNISGTLTSAGGVAGGASIGLGGSGGTGGIGGEVKGTTGGKLTTLGNDSDGLVVQSVGGGGGSGAMNISGNVAAAGGVGVGLSFGLGGSGGNGGLAGKVTGTAKDDVYTQGDRSRGVLVQSTGGGGGAGGFSVDGGVAIGGAGAVTIGVGLGGAGGGGGKAGEVIASARSITTKGDSSAGFIAQSVGGGGGTGGFAIKGALAVSTGVSGNLGVGVGGSGGGGGAGGTVDATVVGDVVTSGINSGAVLAQSIGGGGGTGGFVFSGGIAAGAVGAASVNVGVGGSGGSGGSSDTVKLTMTGQAVTGDVDSDGIVAQSLGGGGGSGGFNIQAGLTIGGSGAGTIGVGVGGSGGGGGSAGKVTMRVNDGATASDPLLLASTTLEDRSRGVIAQSIGGGGGAGGFNITAGATLSGAGGATVGVGVGGSGGDGGTGGMVDARISGRTATTGDQSTGVIAQSIGGGGGSGGFNVTGGLTASGGGAGTVSVGVGGSGGKGGAADSVQLGVNAGVITPTTDLVAVLTDGINSDGIVAQSLGGGGGSGGFNVSGTVTLTGGGGGGVSIGIGGSGGGGGNAGKAGAGIPGQPLQDADYSVIATIKGRTATKGFDSDAIVAQSIGGGGGDGGFNVSADLSLTAGIGGTGSLGIGGSGGSGGNAGAVKLRLNEGADATNPLLFAASTESARSRGIVVQSLGGGGGNGGFNLNAGVAIGGTGAGTFSVGIGGSGGGGGFGSSIDAAITGRTSTLGDSSEAVVAQSIGGGGGAGGFTVGGGVALGGTGAISASFGIGGSGGGGGDAGAVKLGINQNVVVPDLTLVAATTDGENSRGIVAQSIGGGGGAGGFSVQGNLAAAGTGAGSVSIGIGGSGGDGGNGSAVDLAIQGRTATLKKGSDGVLAQSVGGGGGNGGFNLSASVSGAGTGAGTVGFGIGGTGGGGGNSGRVDLDINSGVTTNTQLVAVNTSGDQSRGIVAQSLGGGGGNGAFNVTAGITLAGTGAGTVGIGIGGSGGDGGDGEAVDASISGRSITLGKQSDAVLAQSVGGGGGSGGMNITGGITIGGQGAGAVSVGVGGSGGGGGDAGPVDLAINTGILQPAVDLIAASTYGENSRGIVAQSVGGGGGDGAFNITGQFNGAGKGAGGVAIGVGGSGGDGGLSKKATLVVQGRTLTTGKDSDGVVVQSVGGGGGNGGFNVTGGISLAGQGAGTVAIGVGGSGGKGGQGGDAEATINGTVKTSNLDLLAATTFADRSRGVVVQSLGGGGGNGAFNISGVIQMAGKGAGGGAFGVGGSGADAGNAGAATASITGRTDTSGTESDAIFVQSVGGGGGSGGFNVSAGISISTKGAGTLAFGIGGSGGGGGEAGAVDVKVNAGIVRPDLNLVAASTTGMASRGIVAQSVGGGGGDGAFNVSGQFATAFTGTAGGLAVGIGGSGGKGGSGGTVTADITGITATTGKDSSGILAQSVGGGGGSGGFNLSTNISIGKSGAGNVSIGIGGSGGDGGNGGTVTLDVNQRTSDPADTLLAAATSGDSSTAIVAQSVGGGGGNGGFNVGAGLAVALEDAGNAGFGLGGAGGGGGFASKVTSRINGDIVTTGTESGGALIQSVGGGGGSGGFNVSGGLAFGMKGKAGNLMLGFGGYGGDGGNGGDVDATFDSDIFTTKDKAYGATIQSLGGSGGVGGMNVSGGVSLSMSDSTAGTLGVGIGGFGGGGGDAGNVKALFTGNIQTQGIEAHGLLVQSQGGGGGAGGMNITGGLAMSKGTTGTIGFGLGGFGGDGGDGGTVDATTIGLVRTIGANSYGALFQSVGGAGGAGAINVTGGINMSTGGSTSAAIAIGVGGFGGGGGDGKRVTADVTGAYRTDGANSAGVVAMSVGGGGGDGGLNVSGAVGISFDGKAGGAAFGLGGFGGDGGVSGDVTLTRVGQTVTTQRNSDGVVAMSVGGGGGRGGLNISGGVAVTNNGDGGTLVVGVGGFGGGGGDAGAVTATVRDSVWATGADAATAFYPDAVLEATPEGQPATSRSSILNGSSGIVIESLGGGGGSGGVNISQGISIGVDKVSTGKSLVFGLGGFGGAGGDAGIVNATIGALTGPRIQVQGKGNNESAVYIGSVGGGGGDGSINVSGAITTDGSVTAGIGGSGAGGGLGRLVNARVDADLFATGYQASGLTVQSLGGGGGNGGMNFSGGIKVLARTEPVITFGMGGDGGVGNSSGNVNVTQEGQVVVDGFNVNGVLVQSIAGGGGAGGMNFVAAVNQSGGKSQIDGFTAGIGVGGSGGKGGVAGDAYLRSNGDVLINTVVTKTATGTTLSAGAEAGLSSGVTVQSIGGGGGSGGFNLVGVLATSGSPLTVAVGGSGAVGGDAGTVTVVRGIREDGSINRSLINTFGFSSNGLVAQSIGGGGGSAATNLSFTLGTTKGSKAGYGALFQIGGDGASSGNAKAVDVTHVGSIQTDGEASNGILAQSIGKGGGNAAVNVGVFVLKRSAAVTDGLAQAGTTDGLSVAVGGAAGDAGSSGNVTVSHDGTIVTKQAMSSAIVAQSLAGGGGNVALNMGLLLGTDNNLKLSIGRSGGKGGVAGDVLVNATGLLVANGDQSNGIVAQSVGGAGGMSGTVTVEGQFAQGSGTEKTKNGIGVSVGLEGAAGGHSGTVTVANKADIQTSGDSARGIIAQSIGGDGGIAGSARILTTGQADSLAIAVGGGGGAGAISSKVTVDNAGLIVTTGDKSDGVLAQSIGGGGGVAGSASTIKFPTGDLGTSKSAGTIGIAVGGSGGDGAIAGDVDVTNIGTISTTGVYSYGVRAQSIGGGGGVGGATYNVELQKGQTIDSFNLLVGGGGGVGQVAGRVDVRNYGIIKTTGVGASGISANSIGGGGGDAGSVSNLSLLRSPDGAGEVNAVQIAIGGSGGKGGAGGTVNVVNAPNGTTDSGTIITEGATAHGIFAQSLGGGGGNGSSILSILVSNGKQDSMTAGLNIGGFGGDGNIGGDVTVDNAGLIRTGGEGAIGILAQSIGGGGGNGGVVISTNISFNARKTSPLVSVGGIGGDGNDGGHVTVVNSGRIITTGKNADGIVAQSIGGGGGNAGLGLALTGEPRTLVASNLLSLLVGAVGGGSSGQGGQVDVTHSGDITVLGEGSQAIVAESINGGGGKIRFDTKDIAMPSISAALPDVAIPPLGELDGIPNLVKGEPVNKPVAPVIVAARVGSTGVASMNAGKVNVTITGTMGAGGDYGTGVTLRSIGGGGGDLTISGTLVKPDASIAQPISAQVIYAVGLGAKDSTDSSGADIDTTHNGSIFTTGRATPGVLLQSVGGGGGSALVNLKTEDASIIDSVRLGLGGVGTSGSVGGGIVRTQTGAVATTEDLSHGALVQSIGGGGGSAIGHVELVKAPSATPALIQTSLAAAPAQPSLAAPVANAIVTLGADSGAGNDGGAVDLGFTGGFMTMGAYANGLIVQSIGGGGGEVSLDGLQATTIRLGGLNGAGGSGGNVNVRNDGQIVTLGTGSNGLVLQSIGGGGGAVYGAFAAPSVTLSGDNSGNGGTIGFTQNGDVLVAGDRAYGVLAQSLGGGGGLIDTVFAGTAGGVGSGGTVSLKVNGSVLATGAGSTALLAQSLGSLGGGNIDIATTGNVRGGSGTGAAIRVDGGATNTVRSSGTLSSVSGLAVVAGIGDDQVINTGLAVGNFQLGGGANTLLNASGATLVTIDTIDLKDGAGSTGTFTNAGQLNLGLGANPYPIDLLAGATQPIRTTADPKTDLLYGTRVISQVALDGDFVQTRTGSSQFDVAFGPYASDRFNVTGKATVAGTANITLTWLENDAPVSLWTAAGGGIDNGLVVPDTLAIDYRVIANAQGIQLGLTSNFGLPFLNRNEQAIGRSLDSAVTTGNAAGIGRLLALLGNLSTGQEATYQRIMGELDPEPLLAPGLVEFAAARDFSSNMFGCTGVSASTKCVWGRVERNDYRRNGKGGDQPFEQDDNAQLRAGIQLPFQEDWVLAGAVGYDDSGDLRFNGTRATAEWTGLHGGIALRRNLGADARGSISVGVAAGIQWVDTSRRQSIFVDAVGRAKFKNDYVAFNANARYTLNSGDLFARPELNLSYVGLGQRSFEETGLLGLGVDGLRHREWIATATPGLTLGVHLSDAVQLSVNGAAVLHNRSSYEAPFRLIGADAAADPALINSRFDKTAFAGGVDLLLMRQQAFSVDVGYRGEWGETTTSQTLRAKMTLAF